MSERATGSGDAGPGFYAQVGSNLPSFYDAGLGPIFLSISPTISPDGLRPPRRCACWRPPPAPASSAAGCAIYCRLRRS